MCVSGCFACCCMAFWQLLFRSAMFSLLASLFPSSRVGSHGAGRTKVPPHCLSVSMPSGGGAELMRSVSARGRFRLLQQMCIEVVGDACEEVQTRVATVDVVVSVGVDVHVELFVGLYKGFAIF